MIHRIALRSVLAGWFLVVSACAGGPVVVSDGSAERRAAAEQDQRAADSLRQGGAYEAARQAQDRADSSRAAADAKPASFLDWLADILLYSWLNTASEPSRRTSAR